MLYTPSRPEGPTVVAFIAMRTAISSGSTFRSSAASVWDLTTDHRPGQTKDVLGDLRLPIGEEERYATVQGVDHASTVAHDRLVDLAADRVLDVRDADAERRIGAVEDEADLALLVAELFGDLQEEAHVLDARDFETEHRQDHIGGVEDGQRRVVEVGGAVDDDEVVVGAEAFEDLLDARRR